MTIIASLVAKAASLRTSTKGINLFLSSSNKWTSSRRSICTSSTSGGLQDDAAGATDATISIYKEEFEVGSRMVSFTTTINNDIEQKKKKKMDLSSSFSQSNILNKTICHGDVYKVESINKGEVVMDIEKTKIISTAEAGVKKPTESNLRYYFDQYMGKYYYQRGLDQDVMYEDNKFLSAQQKIHSAKQKTFPSPALMRRPSASDIILWSIRDAFPAGYYSHDFVQATINVLESDGQQDPAIMAANATSAALMVSGILWGGPIGVVRIGKIKGSEDGGLVINPTMDQIIFEGLDLNLVYARTRDKTSLILLDANEVSERDVEAALRLAHHEAEKYIEPQIRLAERAGAHKEDYKLYMLTDQSKRIIKHKVLSVAEPRFKEAIISNTNHSHDDEFRRRVKLWHEIKRDVIFGEECDSCPPGIGIRILLHKIIPEAIDIAMKNVFQRMIIEKGIRADGRRLDQVREPHNCESGVFPVQYGSSIFELGHDALVRHHVSLWKPSYDDDTDSPDDDYDHLHCMYDYWRCKFGISSLGVWQTLESAFLAVLPPEDDFPYEVEVHSEKLCLNGKGYDYMASICGASLALMDAGIPLKRHVAGVSIGLVSDVDPSSGKIKDYRILTDVDNDEHRMGNMFLKIAGTRKGVTAIELFKTQAEIGIPLDIICECLEPALKARHRLLDHMERDIVAPRLTRRSFIQNGWIWRTIEYCNTDTDTSEHRFKESFYDKDYLRSLQLINDEPAVATRKNIVVQETLARHYRVGKTFEGIVFLIREGDGVFIGEHEFIGFIHIAEMLHNEDDIKHMKMKISDLVSIGQILSASCIGYDTRGFFKLSLKNRIPYKNE